MRLHTFALTSAMYSAVPLFGRLLGLLVLPVMTRYLSPEDYGTILLVTNTLAFLTLGLVLGMDQAFAVFLPQSQTPDEQALIASTLLWFRVAVFGGAAALAVLGAPLIGTFLQPTPDAARLVMLVTVGYLLMVGADHFSAVLRLQEHHRVRVALEGARLVVLTLATLAGVTLGWRLEGFYLGTAVAQGLFCVAFAAVARRSVVLAFSTEWFGRMLRFGAPLLTSTLSVLAVQNTASFFINATESLTKVGYYFAATQISGAVNLIASGFGEVWVPYVYRTHQQPGAKEDIGVIFRVFNTALLSAALGLAVYAKEVLYILTDSRFHAAFIYVPLLVLNQSVNALASRFGIGITISGKTWHRIWINGCYAAAFMVPGLLLSPVYGIWAVILSQVFANVVLGVLVQIVSQRLVYLPYGWRHTVTLWALGCAVAVGLLAWGEQASAGLSWTVVGVKAVALAAFLLVPVLTGYLPLPAPWRRRLGLLPWLR